MAAQNEIDQFLYRNLEEQELDGYKREEEKRRKKEFEHIKVQLQIKKSYAVCLFITCVISIIGKIYKPDNYDNVELFIQSLMVSYVFFMELLFKKQY